MNSPLLSACVAGAWPYAQVLRPSGYIELQILASGVIGACTPYLPKPSSPDGLARQARDVPDRTGT
ncbi:MAG: hypothetical protein ABIL09_14965 [Gemmatimonadota bacterium]